MNITRQWQYAAVLIATRNLIVAIPPIMSEERNNRRPPLPSSSVRAASGEGAGNNAAATTRAESPMSEITDEIFRTPRHRRSDIERVNALTLAGLCASDPITPVRRLDYLEEARDGA